MKTFSTDTIVPRAVVASEPGLEVPRVECIPPERRLGISGHLGHSQSVLAITLPASRVDRPPPEHVQLSGYPAARVRYWRSTQKLQ